MIIRNIALLVASNRVSIAIMQNLDGMAGFFQRHLAGTDNLRVVSIILLLLAFILFLFLVVILYIKSLLNFIKNETTDGGSAHNNVRLSGELNNEKELEKELAKDLEKFQQRQAEQLRKQQNLKAEQNRRKNAEAELEKNSRKTKRRMSDFQPSSGGINIPMSTNRVSSADKSGIYANKFAAPRRQDFDWRSAANNELDELSAGIIPFQRSSDKQSVDAMSGLILNMLSRNIDAVKIAQVIRSKCDDSVWEDDIIQFIDALRNFVSLCNNGKFANLPNTQDLPTSEDALYGLAQNDPTYSLQLLEALMNYTMDKGNSSTIPQKRDLAFMEASNYACTFGTLSAYFDEKISNSSFELAIEFSMKNVNAWSRIGDMYVRNQSDSKAIWAYQNLLKIADENHHLHQIANANKHLAQFYYDQGDTLQATKLYNSSQDYYESIGINRNLTNNEKEVVKIIESKQEADIPETVNRLIKVAAQRQRGYV